MEDVKPQDYFGFVWQERHHESMANRWNSRMVATFALGMLGMTASLALDSAEAPDMLRLFVGTFTLGSLGASGISTAAMAPHLIRYRIAANRADSYELESISAIANSSQGAELSWVADFIDPPTED